MDMTDQEIQRLVLLPKTIANPKARWSELNRNRKLTYEAVAEGGERFRIFLRQNTRLTDGYTAGIAFVPTIGPEVVLRRYNGSDHQHSNPLDPGPSIDFKCHIHLATERYLAAGHKAEHYAEETNRYEDLDGAFSALLADCNVSGLDDNQDSPPEQSDDDPIPQFPLF